MASERKKSVGNESIFTVASSLAEELVNEERQNSSYEDEVKDGLKTNLNRVKIDGSKAIQVGDIIHNYYTPSSRDSQQSFSFQKDPSTCFRVPTKFLIIVISAAVFVVASSIGVTFWSLNNIESDNVNNKDKSTTETNLNTETVTPELIDTTSTFYDTSTESTTEFFTTELATTELPLVLPDDVTYFKRQHWDANPPKVDAKELKFPIERIIIAHTADKNITCFTEIDCKLRVKLIQSIKSDLNDIPFNFLIGDDGNIYEGTGFYFEGEHTANINATSYNDIGICVAFIGTYSTSEPSAVQIKTFKIFLNHFNNEGVILSNYTLFRQDQLTGIEVPATALYEIVEGWENFYEVSKVYRRDEWDAYKPCAPSEKLELPILHVLIDGFGSNCTNLDNCIDRLKSQQFKLQSSCVVNDIKYGFVIGTNGFLFEGRGFDVVGEALDKPMDLQALAIAFIGNFKSVAPNDELISSLFTFLGDAVKLGKISNDYKIYAAQDMSFYSDQPGQKFLEVMRTWDRYSNAF